MKLILSLLTIMMLTNCTTLNPNGVAALNNWIQQDQYQKNQRQDLINQSTRLPGQNTQRQKIQVIHQNTNPWSR